MPILVSPNGKKMSKRDGEVHVEQYLVSHSSIFFFLIELPFDNVWHITERRLGARGCS